MTLLLSCFRSLVGISVAVSLAQLRTACATDSDTNCSVLQVSHCDVGNTWVQTRHDVVKLDSESNERAHFASDCGSRFGHGSSHPSACVVVESNRALLVRVPYGKRPGWDLPGGYHKSHEAPCATAEREVCEETGYRVRTIKQLSQNVFECEVVAADVCKTSVDEGFLKTKWVTRREVDSVTFRGGSWGDKKGFLIRSLNESSPTSGTGSSPSGSHSYDACGCKLGQEGWSTTVGVCRPQSTTDDREASICSAGNGTDAHDACGCKVGHEGWSTPVGACRPQSTTDAREASRCSAAAGSETRDACGCTVGQEGWSTTVGGCRPQSRTDDGEASRCSSAHGGKSYDSCGCIIGQEGWSSRNNRCSRGSTSEAWEERQCLNQIPFQGSSLVQVHRDIARIANGKITSHSAGSSCARKFGHGSSHPAACVVVESNRALLVKVPYGERPGWDLPGGYHKSNEAPCATAEREVCEETGYKVRATKRLSHNVFKCEVVAAGVCKKPVDEGFLTKKVGEEI